MMRCSTLLLASSILLQVSAAVVKDPNQEDNTFLESKNDTRRQRFLKSHDTTENDERMLEWKPIRLSEKIRSLFSRKVKTPEQIFENICVRAQLYRAGNEADQVFNAFATMRTKKLEQAIATFMEQDMYLAEKFIDKWGIEAVADALNLARFSYGQEKKNGVILEKNLMAFWSSKNAKRSKEADFANVFGERLKLTVGLEDFLPLYKGKTELAKEKRPRAFDTRITLLHEYIKMRKGNENDFVQTLKTGFLRPKKEGEKPGEFSDEYLLNFLRDVGAKVSFGKLFHRLPNDVMRRMKLPSGRYSV